MPNRRKGAPQADPARDGIHAQLAAAANGGAPIGLILAARGRIWPVPGKHADRWRMRTGKGHVFTFRSEFVVAFDGNGRLLPGAPAAGAPPGRTAEPPTAAPEARRASHAIPGRGGDR